MFGNLRGTTEESCDWEFVFYVSKQACTNSHTRHIPAFIGVGIEVDTRQHEPHFMPEGFEHVGPFLDSKSIGAHCFQNQARAATGSLDMLGPCSPKAGKSAWIPHGHYLMLITLSETSDTVYQPWLVDGAAVVGSKCLGEQVHKYNAAFFAAHGDSDVWRPIATQVRRFLES